MNHQQQQFSTGTGAAHGQPAARISEEPTLKDKVHHIKDKITGGHKDKDLHNPHHNTHGQHHAATTTAHGSTVPGHNVHGGNHATNLHGSTVPGHNIHGGNHATNLHGNAPGAADGLPNHRMQAEPTMKDKAAHGMQNVKDKLTPGDSTSHTQRVEGYGAPGMKNDTYTHTQTGVMPGQHTHARP